MVLGKARENRLVIVVYGTSTGLEKFRDEAIRTYGFRRINEGMVEYTS